MVAPFQGGCRCGAIRYEVSSEPLAVMNCHCRDCQYTSGGGFCGVCGTPVFSEPQDGPIWVVKAATLDDPSWLKLGGNLYTKSAQPWSHIDPNLMQFETMPPRPG